MVRVTKHSKRSNRRNQAKKGTMADSPSSSSENDREQLVEQLTDLGIRDLRDFLVQNSCPVQKNVSRASVSVARESRSSSLSLMLDADSNQVEVDERMQRPPPRYSLFTCPSIAPGDVPSVIECCAPALRKAIHEGKDVSLAHLLMPGDDFPPLDFPFDDPRLHRSLSLPDFILAFVRYMNILTEVHPERRAELTSYLSSIVKLAVQYPAPLFYEYHQSFSRKAASVLLEQGRRLDWSVRDNELFLDIFAGYRSRRCDRCSSVGHSTDFCPSVFHEHVKAILSTAHQREVAFGFNGYLDYAHPFSFRH